MSGLRQNLFGRKVIYTDCAEITEHNVVDILKKALSIHERNKADIEYLYNFYKGDQPVLSREKRIRPEINNKIVENRAHEIITFKVGYLMGEPVQYVSRGQDDVSAEIEQLNNYTFVESKSTCDKELAEWFSICGTAYRVVLPAVDNDTESPFEMDVPDPRSVFVVRHSGFKKKVVMGVIEVTQDESSPIYSIYTHNRYFEIRDDKIIKSSFHILGRVPIIEYPANNARLGEFEIVLPLLNAINDIDSNRLDGLAQFIQALLVFKGVDVEDDNYGKLRRDGGIAVPAEGDVKYLVQELNQTQIQTLKDDLYESVLTICGMPNRNGGSSTSDTGSAVIMRDGWSSAEARAKASEEMFKKSDKEFLSVALRIMEVLKNIVLKLSSIDIRFTRRNYENIQGKSQVLNTMLANDKIHPRLAFECCGMFTDPEVAYNLSMKYAAEQVDNTLKKLADEVKAEADKQKVVINGSDGDV